MPPSAEPLRAAAVILAAGASSRMGENKMLLELGGEPLARRAARRALEAGLAPVVVVLGREPERVRAALDGLPCDFALNPHFTGPTSGSLHRGLERLPVEVDAAVVILGDMPAVTTDMLRGLVDAAASSDAPLAVSRYGEVHAPPLLFRRPLFAELLAWTGEGCGKAVVQRHLHEALLLDRPPGALADVDTPDDLAAARAAAAP